MYTNTKHYSLETADPLYPEKERKGGKEEEEEKRRRRGEEEEKKKRRRRGGEEEKEEGKWGHSVSDHSVSDGTPGASGVSVASVASGVSAGRVENIKGQYIREPLRPWHTDYNFAALNDLTIIVKPFTFLGTKCIPV